MTVLDAVPARVRAGVLRGVVASAHPRSDIPSIASRFDLTVEVVKTIIDHAGYPSTALLTAAAERYEREAAAERSTPPPAEPVHDDEEDDSDDAEAQCEETRKLTLVELMEWAENVGRVDAMKARNRVARAVNSLRDLHTKVAVREAERAAAKAEVERLQAELAEARARLRRPAAEPTEGSHVCDHDDCGRPFKSKQGLSTHKTRAHGGS